MAAMPFVLQNAQHSIPTDELPGYDVTTCNDQLPTPLRLDPANRALARKTRETLERDKPTACGRATLAG